MIQDLLARARDGVLPTADEARRLATATDLPAPDFAANSWPPQARAKALQLLHEANALHLCGGRAPAML